MKLNTQHFKAISLLSEGLTNKVVAEKLDVAAETISRWKSDFCFQAALNQLLSDNQRASQERLRSLSDTALTTIEQIMTDPNTPPKERLTASLKIIEMLNISPHRIGSTNPAILAKENLIRKILQLVEANPQGEAWWWLQRPVDAAEASQGGSAG